MNRQECKSCKQVKHRERYQTEKGYFRWQDAAGRKWRGYLCPDCALEHARKKDKERCEGVRNRMHSARSQRLKDLYIAPGTKINNCKRCGNRTLNYYHCRCCLVKIMRDTPHKIHEADFNEMYGV